MALKKNKFNFLKKNYSTIWADFKDLQNFSQKFFFHKLYWPETFGKFLGFYYFSITKSINGYFF